MNIEDLISQYIDGTLSSEAEAELHHRLSISPEARQLFRTHIMLRGVARDQRVMHAPTQEMRSRLFERLQREEGMQPTAEASPGSSVPSSPAAHSSSPTMSSPAGGGVPRSIPSAVAKNVARRRRRLMPWLLPLVIAGLMVAFLWNTGNEGARFGEKTPTFAGNSDSPAGASAPSMAGDPVPDDMGPAVTGNPSSPQSSGSVGLSDQGAAGNAVAEGRTSGQESAASGSIASGSAASESVDVSSSAASSMRYRSSAASDGARREAELDLASRTPHTTVEERERRSRVSNDAALSRRSTPPPPAPPPASISPSSETVLEFAATLDADDLSSRSRSEMAENDREARDQNQAAPVLSSSTKSLSTKSSPARAMQPDLLTLDSTSDRKMSQAIAKSETVTSEEESMGADGRSSMNPSSPKKAAVESDVALMENEFYDNMANEPKLSRHKADMNLEPSVPPTAQSSQPSGPDIGVENQRIAPLTESSVSSEDLGGIASKRSTEGGGASRSLSAPVEEDASGASAKDGVAAESLTEEGRTSFSKEAPSTESASKEVASRKSASKEGAVKDTVTVTSLAERQGGGGMLDSPLSPQAERYRVMLLIGAHENSLVGLESSDLNFQVAVKLGIAYGPHQFYGMVGGGGYREVMEEVDAVAPGAVVRDTTTRFDELFGGLGYRYTFLISKDLIIGFGGWGGIGNRYSRIGGEIPVIYQISRWIRAEVIPGIQYARTRGSSTSIQQIGSVRRTQSLERETDLQLGIGIGVTMIW